jgi:PAS domain S-box-containing protein
MNMTPRVLFDSNPDPMWVFDQESLRILEVNEAALESYGYTRQEFLALTIADLRPEEDIPRLRASTQSLDQGLKRSGPWRHRRKSGEIIEVEISSHGMVHEGRAARLVVARDITRLLAFEQERREALAWEAKLRRGAEEAVRHYRDLCEALPGRHVVLSPDDLTVLSASDGWLAATGLRRDAVTGRALPALLAPEAGAAIGAALARVAAGGPAEALDLAGPLLPGHAAVGWRVASTAIRATDGGAALLVHQLDGGPEAAATAPELEARLRARELEAATARLREQEAVLRNAERLLGLGHWQLDVTTEALRWSDNVYVMYGVAARDFPHTLGAYTGLVHPADREALTAGYRSFVLSGAPVFRFAHRVLRSDGTLLHVRGVGELAVTPGGRVLNGVVRDVTQEVAEADRLTEATELLRIADRTARVGGWRLRLPGDRIEWSAEAALTHGHPGLPGVALEDALGFHLPEDRPVLRAAIEACIRDGTPFDHTLQVLGPDGRRFWLRTIGEAARDAAGRIVAIRGAVQDVSELVEARRRAERQDRRLTEILQSISEAFIALDGAGRFAFLNGEAERLLRRPAAALAGLAPRDAFPELAGSDFERECEAALALRETRRFTYFLRSIDAWLQVAAYPSAEGLALYLRDVTRERADGQELRLLQAAVARMNDILLITDAAPVDEPDGPRIVYVNDAFVRHTGYPREEAIGRTTRMLQGPGTDRRELDRIRAALLGGQPIRSELLNYTKSGEPFWIELDIVPLADPGGTLTHFVAIERDISGRREAEAALRKSEERLSLVARATNDIVWDADLTTGAVWWNDNGRRLFGELPGTESERLQGWMDLLHPEDRDRVLRDTGTALQGGMEVWQSQYRLLDAAGQTRWVMDRAFIIRDEAGRAARVVGSLVDVTEQHALDGRLRQAQKLEAIGQLTGGVAHDFNNLLTIILGNNELLAESLEDRPELRQMAEMAVNAAERGAELTNRLLAFARRQALAPRAIDVGRLAAGMQVMLRRTLGEQIEVSVVRGADGWLAEVDPGQLEVALLNLAINARDAMPGGGRLTIETANAWLDEATTARQADLRPGPYVTISVSDTGTGMSPEVASRAFEPFFTTKEVGKGSGLGLSMVYGFIKQSGGHARLYSEPGHGTVVRLYLPRADAGEGAAALREPEAMLPHGHEHVLLVEDDPMVREHATGLLRGLGYRVTAAEDGQSALERLRRAADVELLFTDVVMPGGMNGAELAEVATTMRPYLRVLYASGYTDSTIIHGGRLDRGVHLLNKPYRRQDLALKVRQALDDQPVCPGNCDQKITTG